ncbi:MAG: radical SAM protein [Selenomonadaceae bacterium]|nr:radical SAM protein [Selenomonadaceae bacterium]
MKYCNSKIDRIIRLNNFISIIENTDKVYLYGDIKDCELFIEYLNEYVKNYNKDIYLYDDSYDMIEDKSVIFVLTTNCNLLSIQIRKLINKGLKPTQIIPPGIFWVYILSEKKGFINDVDINNMQYPVLATIDTTNKCNLQCSTCEKITKFETNDIMSFELFCKILDKLQIIGINAIELYSYTEPFMNPNLYEFAKEVKRRGLILGISTNLSIPKIKKLKECVDLLDEKDWFVVTISGVEQKIYEVNHINGRIENVINNIESISNSSKRHLVRLRLLKFDYNRNQVHAAKALAKKYGLSFEWFHETSGNPFKENVRRTGELNLIENGISMNEYNKSYDHDGFFCRFIHSRNIVINSLGNVELCCCRYLRPYDLGSFLDQDYTVIQLKRDQHPACNDCISRKTSIELREAFPQDDEKISNVLKEGMNVLCQIRQLNPTNFYSVSSTSEYVSCVLENLLK